MIKGSWPSLLQDNFTFNFWNSLLPRIKINTNVLVVEQILSNDLNW